MIIQNILKVMLTLSLLSSYASPAKGAPWLSLWGKVADFSSGCNPWRLRHYVSIPALQDVTVCFHLKLEVERSTPWTVFMYRHPEIQRTELGLGGERGHLVVWLFGEEWTTSQINLTLSQWYSVCLTWSHIQTKPSLYVNGSLINIKSALNTDTSFISRSRRKLSANGSFTLGAGHVITDGRIETIPYSSVSGKVSLFRMWGRARSQQEVTSLGCTEGELVRWELSHWETWSCEPIPDTSLECEWSIYKAKLLFKIFSLEGKTELYMARYIALHWLRTVLPGIHLHTLSVFEVTSAEFRMNTSSPDAPMLWPPPNIDRFQCLVHVNIIPGLDVAAVKQDMYINLTIPYHDPGGRLQLLADTSSIYITPVESFSSTTDDPTTEDPQSSSISTPTFTNTSSATLSPTTTLKIQTSSMSFYTSTITAPSFTTSPVNISELYFQVQVNMSITGDCDPGQIVPVWLNSSLPDELMVVLDLQLLPKVTRVKRDRQSDHFITDAGIPYIISRESFVFQVQVMMLLSDTLEMEEQIRHLLLMPYNNGSISIATENVEISRILEYTCAAETHQTLKGLFTWPETSGGKKATCACPKNPHRSATRHCKLRIQTYWTDPDLEDCYPVVETILDLDHVEVTATNAKGVLEMIKDLLQNQSSLIQKELDTILNKLKDIISISVITPSLGQALIDVISDILKSDSNFVPFTNAILNITEEVGDRIVGYEGSYTLAAPAVAISVVDVLPDQFTSLSFGVTSDPSGTKPEIFINSYPFNGTVAFISLPAALQHSFPQPGLNHSPPRVQFQFFGIPLLFKSNDGGQVLNTFVVSASVTNSSQPIKDLAEDVEVMLQHLKTNKLDKKVQCVYWNFNKNNGQGGWDGNGCRVNSSNSDYTTCQCDHLTHFGVLLDVSRTPLDPANEQILTMITYVGCGISSLFLGITILTYIALEKLRRDYPAKILINLSLALLGLNLVFLVNSWLSSWGVDGLCVAAAATMHYFLLASFTWMGLEAVNMYFALVKVFNVYVPSYILKFCAIGWGIPLGICVLVLIVNREAYGSHLYEDVKSSLQPPDNSDNFCWIQDDVTFYVSVVAYAVLIFLFNIGVFVVVLIQIRQMRFNSPAGTRRGLLHDLKGVASLTLLLGLTWTLGLFTSGPGRMVLLYLFSGLNTLQGLFIFLFHCLMKENVRKQWRIHLCFGRFRLEEHSEWSNSASVGVQTKPKEKLPRATMPSVRSVKSNSTESTSASSDSSQRDSFFRRPNLGLFVNSMALPRAQRDHSQTGGLPPVRG
ncbi:adhesion G-protein coupled receptor G4 [Menidia menidia]